MIPEYAIAGLWGLLSGSGLLVGAVLADVLYGRLTHRMISAVMGFGGGVLIAVVATELIGDRVSAGLGPLAIFALLAGPQSSAAQTGFSLAGARSIESDAVNARSRPLNRSTVVVVPQLRSAAFSTEFQRPL